MSNRFADVVLPPELAEFLRIAVAAAWSGAAVLAGRDRLDADQLGATNKSSGSDWVTDFDRRAEDAIRGVITQARPHDAITGEEYGSTAPAEPSGYRWSVDPLDGTTNFIRNIPQHGSSVALADDDGKWLVGVVAAPALSLTWFALAGYGAWRIKRGMADNAVARIVDSHVSDQGDTAALSDVLGHADRLVFDPAEPDAALIATGFAYNPERRAFQHRALKTLLAQGADVRRIGSAALDLCMVADGTLDGYAEFGTWEWDWAAGMLVAEEAGAPVLRQTQINKTWSAAGAIDFSSLPDPSVPLIRPATPDDYEAIGTLTVQSYVQGGYLPEGHPYAEILQNVADRARRSTVLVAEVEGHVAGSVLLTYPGQPYTEVAEGTEMEFRMLAVHPDFQGRGLARALVGHVLELADKDPDITAVALTSMQQMTVAHQLYFSMGFVRAPHRDWGLGEETFWVFTHGLSATKLAK